MGGRREHIRCSVRLSLFSIVLAELVTHLVGSERAISLSLAVEIKCKFPI